MAVEFGPDNQQSGPKLLHRIGFARTYLKKGELVDNPRRAEWDLLSAGRGPVFLSPRSQFRRRLCLGRRAEPVTIALPT